MLIDIISLPDAPSEILDRQTPMTLDAMFRSVGPSLNNGWRGYDHPLELTLGSKITAPLQRLHKSIHISEDHNYVFETVFNVEEDKTSCLYTKIIQQHGVDVAVSLNAIAEHRSNPNPPIPLSDIIGDKYWRKDLVWDNNPIHSIVPAILTDNVLDANTARLVDIAEGVSWERRVGWRYKPIYDHAPALLEALMLGRFFRSPFHELRSPNIPIRIEPDRWYCSDIVKYQAFVMAGQTHVNHPVFDSEVLDLIGMRPSKISITTGMRFALDGLIDLGTTRYLIDHYEQVIPITPQGKQKIKDDLSEIIQECASNYCQLFDIDFRVFLSDQNDYSSVAIEKNIYDEVVISFHDLVHDNHVCFYSYFPQLALGTLGVGNYT